MRNLIFGIEDGLVSTVGFVSGIASVNIQSPTLLLSGVVLIFVEAFSMAAGSFLSEESARDVRRRSGRFIGSSFLGALVMFLAYLVAGLLVIAPYGFAWTAYAFPWSVGLSLAALFLLGAFSARVANKAILPRAFRAVGVGGMAIGLGVFVARTLMPSF